MNVFKFKNIFSTLINKKKTLKLLKIIDKLYKKKILNEEIILNLIKAFVIIFYLEKDSFYQYYDLLIFLNKNKKFSNKIFKKIKNLNLKKQFNYSSNTIDKIILSINNYIKKIPNKEYEYYLNILNEIVSIVLNIETSNNFRVNMFLFYLNKVNSNLLNIKDLEEIKYTINKYLD